MNKPIIAEEYKELLVKKARYSLEDILGEEFAKNKCVYVTRDNLDRERMWYVSLLAYSILATTIDQRGFESNILEFLCRNHKDISTDISHILLQINK